MTSDVMIRRSWWILKSLEDKNFGDLNNKYACLLLNITNSCSQKFNEYKYIWNGAGIRVAVDGSANFVAKKKLLHETDIVCGDFDSIEASLLQRLKYKQKSLTQDYEAKKQLEQEGNLDNLPLPQVIETPNQKETDFTKALRVVRTTRPDINCFFVLYNHDGSRIDHLFGLIHTLHLIRRRIFLINLASDSISWMLFPGTHIINKYPGQNLCSLVPFAGSSIVKTRGLHYDLQTEDKQGFSTCISTSNICQPEAKNIIVETDNDIFWSIDIQKH